MQTGRFGAAEIAANTSNVVYTAYNTEGNTVVLTLNIVNRTATQADFAVSISNNDTFQITGLLADNVLEASDVFVKQAILLEPNERLVVRSLAGGLSATVWGHAKSIASVNPPAPVAYP